MEKTTALRLATVASLLSAFSTAQTPATHNTVTTMVIENLGPNVNSTAGELLPKITADGKTLYFVRDGHERNRSGQDVWYCEKDADGNWGIAKHPPEPLNSSEKNSSIENVSTDGNSLLIRGAYEDGLYDGAGLSVVMRNKKGGWKDPKKLEIINIKHYTSMGRYNNSCLVPDGKHIIFAFSDANNNQRHDLYISHLKVKSVFKQKIWTEPEKIKMLSLPGCDDFAPFMAADGVTLYYASDRPGTLGDADIWMTRRLDDTWQNWSEPINLGSPINTEKWDAYYSLDARGEEAYMVSSKSSIGSSDIVKVKLVKELRPNPVVLISGQVFNAKTKEPLGANIEYEYLVDGKNVGLAISNPQDGTYKIVLPYGFSYGFLAYADKYISVSDNIDLTAISEYKEIKRDLYLVPLEVGTTIRLNNIFFDVGKATLRPESYPELDRLAELMKDNGKMQIELSGHTDNVGSDDANLKLSDDRARAVTEYLVSIGIKAERMVAKGYGETKPVSTNETDEGRQMNRRVEFTILKN